MVQGFLCEFLEGHVVRKNYLDVCLATDFEFQGRKRLNHRELGAMLSFSDMLLKLLVQLVEVGDKVMCACRSEIDSGEQ